MTDPIWERGENAARKQIEDIRAEMARRWPMDADGNAGLFEAGGEKSREAFRELSARLSEATKDLRAAQEARVSEAEAMSALAGAAGAAGADVSPGPGIPRARSDDQARWWSTSLSGREECPVTRLEPASLLRVVSDLAEERGLSERDAHALAVRQHQAFGRLMKSGDLAALDEEDRGLLAELNSRRDRDIQAAAATLGATLSTGGGTFAVPKPVLARLFEEMVEVSGIMETCTVEAWPDGSNPSGPAVDDTAEKGEWLAENASATEGNLELTNVAFALVRHSSKEVTATRRFLMSTTIPGIEATIYRLLGARIGRGFNERFTGGTDAWSLRGAAGKNTVTSSGTTAPTRAEFQKAYFSVNAAYRRRGVWQLPDGMLDALLGMTVGSADARPLIAMDYARGLGAEPSLFGSRIVSNHDLAAVPATAAANNVVALFGDFRNYWIYTAPSLATMDRFAAESAYAKAQRVGFLIQQLAGGNLTIPDSIAKITLKAT